MCVFHTLYFATFGIWHQTKSFWKTQQIYRVWCLWIKRLYQIHVVVVVCVCLKEIGYTALRWSMWVFECSRVYVGGVYILGMLLLLQARFTYSTIHMLMDDRSKWVRVRKRNNALMFVTFIKILFNLKATPNFQPYSFILSFFPRVFFLLGILFLWLRVFGLDCRHFSLSLYFLSWLAYWRQHSLL